VSNVQSIAVIGGGFMGTGIAESCLLAGADLVLEAVPEVVDRPRVLHLPMTDEQEDAMTDVGDVRRLVQQAIDAGATTVGEIHQRIAAMPLEALETFDSTGTARKVQQLAERSIGNVYETIRDVNQHVGEMAEELLTGAKAGKS
jgi:3-hydroxyisobutyrate dehydrogenase-like beta-hydroxyacid dehydrogenase